MGERCELCRFWQLSNYNGGKIGDQFYGVGGNHADGSVSNCRRLAPTIQQHHALESIFDGTKGFSKPSDSDNAIYGQIYWPQTKRGEWCGEFKAREET